MYQAARNERDLEVLASGDPKKIVWRGKNKLIGRLLAEVVGFLRSRRADLKRIDESFDRSKHMQSTQ